MSESSQEETGMAIGHLLATSGSTAQPARRDLGSPRRRWGRLAHLAGMSVDARARELFEPVLTLAELAEYLRVPVQTLYDLRVSGRGPRGLRVGRSLLFRKSEIEAWLAGLEVQDGARQARSRS